MSCFLVRSGVSRRLHGNVHHENTYTIIREGKEEEEEEDGDDIPRMFHFVGGKILGQE